MKFLYTPVAALAVVLLCSLNSDAQTSNHAAVSNLKCEHLVMPVGIDNKTPRLSWQLNDPRPGALQQKYSVSVSIDSVALANGEGSLWNSGEITGSNQLIIYAGVDLQAFTKYYWRVEVWDKEGVMSPPVISSFETGMLEPSHWKGSWISDNNSMNHKPAPYFRKEFTALKKIRTARAYIAVGGLYELYLNGRKIGDQQLNPMYTRFDRRTLYVTHDVTAELKEGRNAVGVLLGNGWYNHQSTAVWYFHRAPWRARPVFCMDLHITYVDGSTQIITTDASWKTATGPLVFNSIYTGEHYDARLEQPGWNTTSFNDSTWKDVALRPAPSQNIVAQVMQPIRHVEELKPVHFQKINDTTFLYDLGRNIAGISRITVKGNQGTVLHLKHGERLGKDGRIDMRNIDLHYRPTDNTDPFQTDIYMLSGNGVESFQPRFNYKGFQFIEVTSNSPVVLTAESVTGYFMHSDVEPVGTIHTSNAMMNKLWKATNNSYLSNLFGYPTDCPQREKNGWTGDAHIASETGLYNYDGITIYEKWLADHRDEQQPNGVLPAIIPTSGWGYQWANGPDWTSTIAIIPWNVYLFSGDRKILADNYENIKRYVNHIDDLYPSGLTTWGLGDWVPVKSVSPVELTSSIYYFADVSILEKTAILLHKTEDAGYYASLAEKIRDAINVKYLNMKTGVYGTGLQTELSAPLYWGIVPEELRSLVAANLARKVMADNYHLDTGILGAKAILNALSENGYTDVAYTLSAQETYPSWGWWMKNGATTLYENWDIQATSDISLNHIMFGEIGAWLYKGLGGIYPDPAAPGFKHIILKPGFPDGLTFFECSYNSPYGKITSVWHKHKNKVSYQMVVPPNATASFYVPKGFKITSGVLQPAPGFPLVLPAGLYEFELRKI